MKFARFWRDVSVDVDGAIPGVERISIWGASNDSPEAAAQCAAERASLFRDMLSKGLSRLQEYEYWSGYIREEVLDEIQSPSGDRLAVITRNNYGSIVLNSDSVLFGDIDIPEPGLLGRILGLMGKSRDKTYFLSKVEKFQASHPQYSIRVYETSAGLRFVVTNRLFQSDSSEVQDIFRCLDVDPLYIRLCKQQACFRARLTPKPWRIGLDRPPTRFPQRLLTDKMNFEKWQRSYERASKTVSVARLLSTFGHENLADIRRVIEFHDRYVIGPREQLA